MPYFDVPLSHPHFEAVQKIGATGILKGQGVPTGWANRTYFHPDSLVKRTELAKDMAPYFLIQDNHQQKVTLSAAIDIIMQMAKQALLLNHQKNNQKVQLNPNHSWNYSDKKSFTLQIQTAWSKWKLGYFDEQMPLTRLEFAVLLNATIDPFNLKQVNHQGTIIE